MQKAFDRRSKRRDTNGAVDEYKHLNRAEGRGGYSGDVDLKKKTKAKSKGKGQPFFAEKGPRGPDALGLGLPPSSARSGRGAR